MMIAKKLFLLLAAIAVVACGDSSTSPSGGGTLASQDLTVGTGATAVAGDTLTVHYVLTVNGNKVQSSYDTNSPFTFRLGTGAVIQGWDQGVPGMRVGGKRRLTIPPSLGYGNTPQNGIPANSTLVFDIELVRIAGK
jgi:peptidylprolyl isomerase